MKYRVVHSQDVFDVMRFDGSYHNADANIYDGVIKAHSSHNLSYYCSRIFTSGRNKRAYTIAKNGVPFLSNSDVMSSNPILTCKYSSKKYGFDEDALLKKGMILTGRVGAVGQTTIVNSYVESQKAMGSDNIIRIIVDSKYKNGYIYAYLASKVGKLSLWKQATGGVQPFITDKMVGELPIPDVSEEKQNHINDLIQSACALREEAEQKLQDAQELLISKSNLSELSVEDYDFYGLPVKGRKVSTFIVNKTEITSTTINAFNYSNRVKNLKNKIVCETLELKDVIENNSFFSTGSFPRVEVLPDKGIMLINQSDIFDTIIRGKHISKRGVKIDNLVHYGEILIAGVGTLGENETFCRVIFANEDIEGQLVSGEFIRMKTNGTIPEGYLYAWLSSEYGFRLIRHTQSGTKLCRPIQKILLSMPVPIIDNESMCKIDDLVKKAHSMRHKANIKELNAISLIEQEIEKWNN